MPTAERPRFSSRCRITLAELPARLAGCVDPARRTLHLRTTDVGSDLRDLLQWADRHRLGLSALEVGAPSLEDAYLALVDQPRTPEADTDAPSTRVA